MSSTRSEDGFETSNKRSGKADERYPNGYQNEKQKENECSLPKKKYCTQKGKNRETEKKMVRQ